MINKLFVIGLLTVLPLALVAQTAGNPQEKSLAKTKVKVNAKPLSKSRVEAKTTANQMASGFMAAEAALTPAELAIAERVFQGNVPCELGAVVTLNADPKAPGYFDVQIKNIKYRMFPVISNTGAIRLEDHQAGAVWLQLANKSMLMNQKLGQRLADACMNPEQALVAEMMFKNPPPSLLDTPVNIVTK